MEDPGNLSPRQNGFFPATRARAAQEVGAYRLGWAFFHGKHGLSKDPARARVWLKRVVDGECCIKHLSDSAKAKAAEWLRELDA